MSSRRSGSAALFGGVLLLVLVAGFAAMGKFSASQGGAPTDVTPKGLSEAPATEAVSPQPSAVSSTAELAVPPLLVLVRDGATTRIVQHEQGKGDRTLFTDSDEIQKVQQVVGLGTDKVYVLVGTDPVSAGRVASIALDGSGKLELLSEPILTSSIPAARSDGQRLALVTFDNAEQSFGFTLKTQTLKGAGEKTIDTSESGLALARWSVDGTHLAFTKDQATPEAGQEVRVAANESNPATVYTTEANHAVTDLAWLGTSEVLLVIEPLGNEAQNQAKLVRLNLAEKSITDVADDEGKERGLAVSPDGAFAGYIAGRIQAGTSFPSGIVTIRSLSSGQSLTLDQASSVIGWVK